MIHRKPFTHRTTIKPSAAYELSKLESEEQQREVAAEVAGVTLGAKGRPRRSARSR